MGVRTLSPAVRAALEGVVVDGLVVRFEERLDRETFKAAAKVLAGLGGRYRTGRAAGYVFPGDPAPGLARVLAGGPVSDRAAEGYVRTPDPVADMLCRDYALVQTLPAGSRVLEPSAGDGSLVRAVHRANSGVKIVAVEPNLDRAAQFRDIADAYVGTFEAYAEAAERVRDYDVNRRPPAAGRPGARLFNAVVMNPPFSVPGKPTIWIDHVFLAWGLVRAGGRLVAIVPNGYEYRQDCRHREVRESVGVHGGFDPLPERTFDGVRAGVLWAERS